MNPWATMCATAALVVMLMACGSSGTAIKTCDELDAAVQPLLDRHKALSADLFEEAEEERTRERISSMKRIASQARSALIASNSLLREYVHLDCMQTEGLLVVGDNLIGYYDELLDVFDDLLAALD